MRPRQFDLWGDEAATFHESALDALEALARQQGEVCGDDVWRLVSVPADEPRDMGAVMVAGQRLGWIEATDRIRTATRRSRHGGNCRVWRSLLHGNGGERC